ncbi:MAG: hypothetical protein JWL59_4808 [Chthoniobacteraceae bacterium]|nr:hypothetical protein [Chthoniobacteraceae bacterium]
MNNKNQSISVERVDLTSLLPEEGSRFYIPHYQRKYAWTNENCLAIVNDVLAVANGSGTHFFSNLTLSPLDGVGSYYVVDGQQRMTTLGLFIAALAKALPEYREELEGYIKHKEILKLSFEDQVDQRTYRHLLLGHFCDAESLSNIMISNFKFLEKQVLLSINELRAAYAGGFFKRLLFVRVILAANMPPQRVFERMNGTKLPLTPLDLIKNFLLIEAKGREDEVYDIIELRLWGWYGHIQILVSMHAGRAIPYDDIYKHFKEFYLACPESSLGALVFLEKLDVWASAFKAIESIFADLNSNWQMQAGNVWRLGPILMKIAIVFCAPEDLDCRNTLIARIVKSRRSWVATERLHRNKLHRQTADEVASNDCLKSVKDAKLSDQRHSLTESVFKCFEVRSRDWVTKAFAYWIQENGHLEPQFRSTRNMQVLGLENISWEKEVTTERVVDAFHKTFEDRVSKLEIDSSRI